MSSSPDLHRELERCETLQRRLAALKHVLGEEGQGGKAQALLQEIDAEIQMLRASLRAKMRPESNLSWARSLEFDDLMAFEPRDLGTVLEELPSLNVALALKTAPLALREHLYRSVTSRRAREIKIILEDSLGPVRLRDVQTAQDSILERICLMVKQGVLAAPLSLRTQEAEA